jgi:hypothetical protein
MHTLRTVDPLMFSERSNFASALLPGQEIAISSRKDPDLKEIRDLQRHRRNHVPRSLVRKHHACQKKYHLGMQL